MIGKEEVREIAHSARLRLKEEEIEQMCAELETVLALAQTLEHGEHVECSAPKVDYGRRDEVADFAGDPLRDAAQTRDGCFIVPRIMSRQ